MASFVGRVVAPKRVDHIVRALKLIHQTGRTDAHLWIIGAWDERCYSRLSRLIAALGLGEYVAIFGRVDDVAREKLLARAHVLVMTSVRERPTPWARAGHCL